MNYLSDLNDRRDQALQKISDALYGRSEFYQLQPEEGEYKSDSVVWRTILKCNETEWETYIILGKDFPDEPPRVKVPKAVDLLLSNPHVFENGYLCVIPESSSINSNDPVGLFFYIIDSAKHILEGTAIVDFQEEFSSYWNRSIKDNKINCVVIDSPEQLPNIFHVVFRDSLICISSCPENLNQWFGNFLGKDLCIETKQTGIILNLKSPLLPNEYPESLYDLLLLVESKDKLTYNLLEKHIVDSYEMGFILLSQKTDTGYALGGISYSGMGLNNKRSLQKGFRIGKTPPKVLMSRSIEVLKNTKVTRCIVKRVDHSWIHSRGGDGQDYHRCSVLVIGCGSLGGYVAHLLSRSGITDLTLFDNDILEWANLGRHILGAESVSKWKAEALCDMLKSQMPHLRIRGIPKDWRDVLRENNAQFTDYDLIVSTVADWRCEAPLNYLAQNESLPPVLFGWLEPYAVAGHCLVSVKGSGCLACKMNQFGQFEYRVAKFPEKTLKREPGGCTHYQEYGPTALLPVASLITTNVLRCLKNKPGKSMLNTWVSDQEHFMGTGAEFSEVWTERINKEGYSKIYITNWDSSKDCLVCY